MGIILCYRMNCANAMCRYSHNYGYICSECFEELVSLGIQADIGYFMNTPKTSDWMSDADAARYKFGEEFPEDE